jgi:hypothetical protein
MNERIRQLALQAGQGEPFHIPPEFVEKFAELIVKECIGICNQTILQNQDTLSKLNTDELAEKMVIHGSINQAQKLGKGIKQHFGVEE